MLAYLVQVAADGSSAEQRGMSGEYRVHRIPMTTLTVRAVEAVEEASTRDAGRAKNLFALGVLSWLYGRPADVTQRWIENKFARKPSSMSWAS